MKNLFSIVIIIHGLIHGLGFLKAFDLMKIEELSLPISKPIGLQWLLAGFLIIVYVIVDFLEIKNSWMLGLLAVVVSQSLIFYFCKDAKFGTVINILLLIRIFLFD